MEPEELKIVIREVLADMRHDCQLTPEELADAKLVSSVLRRFRNALGNAMMILIFVIALMGIGGILWLVSMGKINLFKVFGLGI